MKIQTKHNPMISILMAFVMIISLVIPCNISIAEDTGEAEENAPYFIIKYYKDEIDEENKNLLEEQKIYKTDEYEDTIEIKDISDFVINAKKPENTDMLEWADGKASTDAAGGKITFHTEYENPITVTVIYKSTIIPGYTINYYKNSVDKDNLIASEYVKGDEGDTIEIDKIDLKKNKPADDDDYDWSDGVIEKGYPEKIVGNTGVINIIFTSTDVAVYTVCYYKNEIADANLIKAVDFRGPVGDKIDIEKIDLNAMKPTTPKNYTWADGKLQPGFAEVIKKGEKNILNVIYTSTLITLCNVTDLGANGYDTLDDTEAIQKALDYSSANFKDTYPITVFIPSGTYYISKTLCIQPNTTLRLAPDATIIRRSSGLTKNMLKNTYNNEHKSTNKKKYNVSQNILVTGGTWDGGDIASASDTSNLIYIGHASNITIENTTVKNCYGAHAIEFAGVKDSLISNCTITGYRYDSSYFTSEAIQFDICYKDSTNGKWTPGFELDKTPCKNVTVQNCNIIDFPRGVGVHHTIKGNECSDINIINNTFTRSSASTQGKAVCGIFLQGAKNINISGNYFDYYSYGAIIKTCTNLAIQNNTFMYNSLGCLNISGCDKNNGNRGFTIVDKKTLTEAQQKKWKKKFIFTAPGIKSGNFKINGKTYKYNTTNGTKRITLKKKVNKKNVTVSFYGKDTAGNKFYQKKKTTRKYLLK